MQRSWRLAVLVVAVLLAGCREAPEEGKVRVAATIFPLADLVEQVGGEQVEVALLVPPGVSPHGFELTGRSRAALQRAQLVVSAGPTDGWLSQAMIPRGAGHLSLAGAAAGHEEHDHDHAESAGHDDHAHAHDHHAHHDPHYWLDPRVMAELAEAVGEALAQRQPDQAELFRQRAADYAAQCRALAEEMRAEAQGFDHRVFIAQHAAYDVLAEMMGLEQVAAIQPVVGSAMTPSHLQALVEQVVEQGVPAIFTEPQLPAADAQAIRAAAARRGVTVKVLVLDPIGNPAVEGRGSYLANMRANLAALKEGLND